VNNQIRVPAVRLLDPDGNQIGIVSISDALTKARQYDLDLVEIAPTAQPPVCRIMDFGKYKFDMAKKEKEARRHQAGQRVKEVKFHPNVEDHDYQTKLRHIREFIADGHRVKASLMFRGREQAHKEFGHQLMNRLMKDVEDVARIERPPEDLGRFIVMMLAPGPRKADAKRVTHGAPAPAPR
jgi:translation initiation factor IF-3